MYKQETLPETQSQMIQAAMLVAQMQAQTFDDEQAQAVKILYPQWQDVIGQTVEKGISLCMGMCCIRRFKIAY